MEVTAAKEIVRTGELDIARLKSERLAALKLEAEALEQAAAATEQKLKEEVKTAEKKLKQAKKMGEEKLREDRDRAYQAKKKVAEEEAAANASMEIDNVRTNAVIQDEGGSSVQNESAPATNGGGVGARSTTNMQEDRSGGSSAHVPAEKRLISIGYNSLRNETVCKREQPTGLVTPP